MSFVEPYLFLAHAWLIHEVDTCATVVCDLKQVCKFLGLYAHLAEWLCNMHLLCGSHIYSVTYVICVYSEKGVET